MRIYKIAAVLIAAAGLAGCSLFGSSSVKIASISPEPATELVAGAKADFNVTVDYVMKEKEGWVSLVVEKEDNSSIVEQREPAKSFVVPDTRSISVSVPLFPMNAGKTDIVDHRFYKVAKKK